MNIRFLIMFLVILGILIGFHVLLYFSFIRFFSISSELVKNILLVTLGVLSVSFIFSVLFARFSNFILVRAFYFISAFWLGALFYIIVATILIFILILVFKHFGIDAKLPASIIVYALTFVYLLLSVWNAMNPVVKNVSVKIRNLPDYWQGKTIVQLSDVHLGKINGPRFARRMVEKVNNLNPDLILITGDLFDGMGVAPNNFLEILNNLKSKDGVYYVSGNHEYYLGHDMILDYLKKETNMEVIDNKIVEIEGLQIVGIGYPGYGQNGDRSDIINKIGGYNSEKPSILLYHEPTSINQDAQDQSHSYLSPKTDFSYQKEQGVDLQISGHTHAGQFFPFNIITKKIFKGYYYGLFTEGDFNLYVTSGTGTWGPPIRNVVKSEIVNFNLEKK